MSRGERLGLAQLPTLGPVSTGMVDRVLVQFPVRCTFISECDQPPRSTQPGHPFVGRRNEYQPKGSDALWLGSKGRYGSCVGGRYNRVIPLLHVGHICAL